MSHPGRVQLPITVDAGADFVTERVQNARRIGGQIEACHAQRIECKLLVLVQRSTPLSVDCPQGRDLRRRSANLGTQVFEHGDRYALQLVERPTTHLHEADLQRCTASHIHAIARQDRQCLATVTRATIRPWFSTRCDGCEARCGPRWWQCSIPVNMTWRLLRTI
jgi:hypothetical protein